MSVQRTFSGAPWEGQVGYCRAVRVDGRIFVSGCAPVDAQGQVVFHGNGEAQAARCLEIILAAVADLGSSKSSIVRPRMFVTDISRWADYGRAHSAVFDEYPPATSMVQVQALIDPDMLIEIEADAILQAT